MRLNSSYKDVSFGKYVPPVLLHISKVLHQGSIVYTLSLSDSSSLLRNGPLNIGSEIGH